MFPSLKTIFSISAKQHPSHSVLLALCYSTSCFSNSAKLQSPGWWSKKTSVWELITLDLTPIDNVRNAKGWGEANNAPPKRSSITQPGRAPAADILFSLHAKVLPRLKWKPCWQAKVSQSKNESLHWPQQHKQKTSREIWRVGWVGGATNMTPTLSRYLQSTWGIREATAGYVALQWLGESSLSLCIEAVV